MAKIPLSLGLLQSGSPQDLQKLLKACILRAEDEILVVTQEELDMADRYSLVTTTIQDEDAITLTVRPR